jgi:hypothetical protein
MWSLPLEFAFGGADHTKRAMSDTGNTSDAPATAPEDLDQRVQALVDEIEQTTARIEQAVADHAEGPERAEARVEPGDAAGVPAASTADAPADPEPEGAGARPAADEASAEPELVEPVGAEPEAAPTDDVEPPAAAPAQPPQSLDALDADLGADLDRLLAAEGCAETPAELPGASEGSVAADPELESELDELLRQGEITAPRTDAAPDEGGPSKLDQQLAGLHDADLEGGPDPSPPESAQQPAAEDVRSVAVAAPPATLAPVPAPEVSRPRRSLVASALVELADLARRSGPRVAAQVEPVAYRAAVVMSKPLEEKPKAKQIIGWLATYTAFLAACVWVYVLFLRPAGPQEGPEGPKIVGAE